MLRLQAERNPYPEGIPAYSVCDRCGMETGIHDSAKAAIIRYRENRIVYGAACFNIKAKPENRNLDLQLKHGRK